MANYSTDADIRPYEDIDNWRPRTKLNGGITSDTTTITVDTVDGFGDVCTLLVESEQMAVSARDLAANTFTVVRGANSTTNAIHSDNVTVVLQSFDWIHDEAKRRIDESLLQRGIDGNWEYDNLPKIFDGAELKTCSALFAAHLLCKRANTANDDTFSQKADWYLARYEKYMGELRPRLVNMDKSVAVWLYSASGTTYTDRTVAANTEEGTPWAWLASASDYIYWGKDELFNSLNCLFAKRGSYSGIVWEYWNGSAWTSFTPTDNTSSFTNITDQQSVEWSSPSGWTPTSISGGVDTRSRYWVRVSAGTVTTAGSAWYAAQDLQTPYRVGIGAGSTMDLGA